MRRKAFKKVLALALALSMVLGVSAQAKAAEGSEYTFAHIYYQYNPDMASQVLELVNQARREANVPELVMTERLEAAAIGRGAETTVFWSHTRPDGSECGTILEDLKYMGLDVQYTGWGENIAYGATTAQQVMDLWMNSEGHRANILNPDFDHIGIACVWSGKGIPCWVQFFTTGTSSDDEQKRVDVTEYEGLWPFATGIDYGTITDSNIGKPAENLSLKPIDSEGIEIEVGDSSYVPFWLCSDNYAVAMIFGDNMRLSSSDGTVVSVKPVTEGEYTFGDCIVAQKEGIADITGTWHGLSATQPVKVVVPPCVHEFEEVTVDPTCTEAGETKQVCKKCGTVEDRQEIPALGHDWGEWSVTKAATCTEKGLEERTCQRKGCGKTEQQTIEALGHDLKTVVTTAATCVTDGVETTSCSRCDYKTTKTLPATGHEYTWVTVKEATFNEDGVRKGTCAKCGDEIIESIPKLSESHTHNFAGEKEVVKAPTCTEEGITYIHCTHPDCTAYDIVKTSALGHTAGDWIVTKEASCTETGSEQRICTVCHEVLETRTIDKAAHTYGEWTAAEEATCTAGGRESAACAVCGEVIYRDTEPLGHDFAKWEVTKEPTCTEEGEEASTCTRCGVVDTRVIDAKGHELGDWTITKQPTLTEDGEREAVCSVCGEVIKETLAKLPPVETPETGSPDKNTGTGASSIASTDVKSAKTGDKAPIIPCVILMVGMIAVGAGVIVRKKKYV